MDSSFRNEYELHLIVKKLRDFYYANFCDFYLESTKPILKNGADFEVKELIWNIIRNCNYHAILMYHPFMPSITEELWQRNNAFSGTQLNDKKENFSILDFKYPNPDEVAEFQVKI